MRVSGQEKEGWRRKGHCLFVASSVIMSKFCSPIITSLAYVKIQTANRLKRSKSRIPSQSKFHVILAVASEISIESLRLDSRLLETAADDKTL
jgi:hypothetical protein